MHGAVRYTPSQCNPSSYLTRVARLLLPDSLKLTADFIDTALGSANVVLDLGDLVQHGSVYLRVQTCAARRAARSESARSIRLYRHTSAEPTKRRPE